MRFARVRPGTSHPRWHSAGQQFSGSGCPEMTRVEPLMPQLLPDPSKTGRPEDILSKVESGRSPTLLRSESQGLAENLFWQVHHFGTPPFPLRSVQFSCAL